MIVAAITDSLLQADRYVLKGGSGNAQFIGRHPRFMRRVTPILCACRLDYHITGRAFSPPLQSVLSADFRSASSVTVQFSAVIVILCEALRLLSHHPGATRPLVLSCGIEPQTAELKILCSIHLSYDSIYLTAGKGLSPLHECLISLSIQVCGC